MALKKFLKDRVGTGVQITLNPADDGLIGKGVTIQSTNAPAVVANGSNQSITVMGTVVGGLGGSVGIIIGNAATDSGNKVVVGTSGSVFSEEDGISGTGTRMTITNAGLIAASDGISLTINGAGLTTVRNSGLISGEDNAIDINGTQRVKIINTGKLVAGDADAFDGDAGAITFQNKGLVQGTVRLGTVGDLFDGRGGRTFGEIFGLGGNDRFISSKGRDVIDGGADTDTLDFRAGPGVRVSLDGSLQGTGNARNDSYVSIENLFGSAVGNDRLRGDINNNVLKGFGGKDTLQGGFGVDTLNGGAGRDVLTGGGTGDDTFVFDSLVGLGDRITDFGNDMADNDVIQIKAAAFKGGLVGGGTLLATQFVERANGNAALDGNDRFIFRTSDTTLWFDADGQGGKGPVLVADLQVGATLSAADFLLV